jgi:hypothetical protein
MAMKRIPDVSMWEQQFEKLVRKQFPEKLDCDVEISVSSFTRKNNDARRISEQVLRLIETYVTSGRVRSWSVVQRPADSFFTVHSVFRITPMR